MTNEATAAPGGTLRMPRAVHPRVRATLRTRALCLLLGTAACVAAEYAGAQVYKCQDAAGRTIYADAPCDAKGKPMHLPDPTWRSGTDPNVCFQLLDELNRLADEVKRNEQRGRKESNSSAARRKSLTQQYETRCVGVSRSAKGAR